MRQGGISYNLSFTQNFIQLDSSSYENNPIAIIQLDNQFNILHSNKLAADFIVEANPATGSHSWLDLFPEIVGGPIHQTIQNTLYSGQELSIITEWPQNGKKFFFTISPLFSGLILLIRELPEEPANDPELLQAENELKRLNISLNERNLELEAKNDELASFAFIASHDLKEPLRKINTFSNWLLEKEMNQLSEQGKAYLQRMQNSVSRMELLIEDILSLLRLQEKSEETEPVDINKVLEKSIEDLDMQVSESNAEIVREELPMIMGNSSSLFYLFNNIISNALKFRHKERSPVIRINCKKLLGNETGFTQAIPYKNYLRLTIEDNGIGFDDKYSKVIFQMFQRLNGKSEYAGTGIGLTICKKIMENHEGFISAHSEPGIGSAFMCFFPT